MRGEDFDDGHTSRDLNLHRHTARYRAATAAGCLCITLIAFGSSHHPAAKSGMHTGLATVATASEQVVRALRTLPKLTVEQHDELAGDKTLRDAFIAQVYQELQRAGTTRHGLSTELPDIHPQSDVLAAMNFSVDPCDNFYEFVCGRWIQDTPIPPDKAVLQKSYSEAQDLVRKQMADMLEDTETPQETPARQRLADYYAACMDVNYVDSLNAAPIMKLLDKIDAIVTHDDLADMIAELASRAMPSLMAMKVSVDADRTRHIIKVTGRNMGMSLPDPSYYAPGVNNASKENSSTPEMEEALAWRRLNFMTLFKEFEALHQLTGLSQEQARKMTTMTMNAEIRLASFFSREPIKEYLVKHPGGLQDTSLEELEQHMPNLPWRRTLEKLAAACGSYNTSCTGLTAVLDNPRMLVVNMDMPVYYASISEALGEYDPASWAPLLRSHVVKQWAPLLGTHFEKVILEAMTALNGVQERPARWHKCSSAAMAALPHEADEVYRELFFPPAAQASGERLLTAIRDAFVHNLETVDWLGRGNDTATRAMALRKAKALTMSLGGTNEPYYTTFAVSRRQYFDNALRAMQAKMIADFSQLGQPVKRNHWNMAAFSVNAYYDRSLNALFIPAGIMQPPFFSPSFTGPADGRLARDFGGIGTVIGHEFSHGFDNNGAKYDDHSLLANWWSPEVAKEFARKTSCIQDLYGGFRYQGIMVDGKRTEPENIADQAGLKIALQAFKSHLERVSWAPHAQQAPHAGLPDISRGVGGSGRISSDSGAVRLYFVSYGQLWCTKTRNNAGYTHAQTENDPHPPGVFRTNGAVSQNADFARAFRCPAGSAMNPLRKCDVW